MSTALRESPPERVSVQLVRYDAARKALAEAKRVDEARGILDVAIAMKAYAKQAQNRELEADAVAIRFRAECRLGDLLRAQKELPRENGGGLNRGTAVSGGPGRGKNAVPKENRVFDATPTLAELGINKKLSSRAQKLASKFPEAKREDEAELVRQKVLQEPGDNCKMAYSTGDWYWFTPAPLIEAARAVLGAIDLDPASCEDANRVVGAARYFTEEENGLSRTWTGRVFMNPPYAQPHIAEFVSKLVVSFEAGTVEAAITLTNNCTEAKWIRPLFRAASAICFPEGRVKFWHPNKDANAPQQGQVLCYLGPNPLRFEEAFEPFGACFGPLRVRR